MKFEWDEEKSQFNLNNHKVDFREAQVMFDGRPVVTAQSNYPDELRFLTTGALNGTFYTVIWTKRDAVIRLISVRRARDAEERNYRSIHR